MLIKDILLNNGFNTININEKILNLDVECSEARLSDKYSPTDSIDIIGDKCTYIINLERNEFAPFTLIEFDDDMNIVVETGFDDDLEVIFHNVN